MMERYIRNKALYVNIRSFDALTLQEGGWRKRRKHKNKNDPMNQKVFTITLKQPWLGLIRDGKKTIEGRLNRGIFSKLRIGDKVLWLNKHSGEKVLTKIVSLNRYDTFREMISDNGIENILPGIDSIEEGVNVYGRYYSDEDQRENGVIALGIEVIDD